MSVEEETQMHELKDDYESNVKMVSPSASPLLC